MFKRLLNWWNSESERRQAAKIYNEPRPNDNRFHDGLAKFVGGGCHHVKPCHPDVAYFVKWNGKITNINRNSYLYGEAQIAVWKKDQFRGIHLVAIYRGLQADAYREGFEVGILMEAASSFGKAEARALNGMEAMYAD